MICFIPHNKSYKILLYYVLSYVLLSIGEKNGKKVDTLRIMADKSLSEEIFVTFFS